MEWLTDIGQNWLRTSLWLAGLGTAFGILARLMPCNPGMYPWKSGRGLITDAIYWFVMPLFGSCSRFRRRSFSFWNQRVTWRGLSRSTKKWPRLSRILPSRITNSAGSCKIKVACARPKSTTRKRWLSLRIYFRLTFFLGFS